MPNKKKANLTSDDGRHLGRLQGFAAVGQKSFGQKGVGTIKETFKKKRRFYNVSSMKADRTLNWLLIHFLWTWISKHWFGANAALANVTLQ